MVAAQDKEVLGILDFVCKKQANSLQGLFSSVHVVSKEKIVCFRRKSSVLEQSKEIIVLSMYIAADLSFKVERSAS